MASRKKRLLSSIDDLNPAAYNPRSIKPKAASGLGKSLEQFGDVGGITWNSRTGNLVCGHQRVEQLRKQGAKFKDGALELNGERWPVRVVDWTLAREKTANVAANNPNIAGEFTDGLGDILADIKLSISDEDFTGLRFDDLYPRKIVEQDEVPEPPKKPVTELGDVWELGRHRVVCGDSVLLEYEKTDAVFTSPPYAAGREIESGAASRYTDPDDDLDRWRALLSTFTGRSLNSATDVFVNLQMLQPNKLAIIEWLFENARNVKDIVVWDKGHGAPAMAPGVLNSCWEFVFVLSSKDSRRKFRASQFHGTVDNIVRVGKSSGVEGIHHKAAFRVEFPAWFISSFDWHTVCDPFLGSGTTLIAAEQLDRICYGIEISPAYCDVIVQRFENLTGKKAKRKKA